MNSATRKKLKQVRHNDNDFGSNGLQGKNSINNVYFTTNATRKFDSDGLVLPRKLSFPCESQFKEIHGELLSKKPKLFCDKNMYPAINKPHKKSGIERPYTTRNIATQLEEHIGKLRKTTNYTRYGQEKINGDTKSELALVYERICMKDRRL